MGAAAAAIPYIIAAVGTAATVYNSNKTARKQDNALAQGIRDKAATQRKADQKISTAVDELGGSGPGGEKQSTLASYQDALRGTEQQAAAGQTLGGLSKSYDEATNANAVKSNKYLSGITDALSTIDAAGQQRQREGFGTADLATNLRVLGREQEGQDFLSRLKAQSIRRNPWIDAFAGAAQSYGSMAGGGASGGGFGGV